MMCPGKWLAISRVILILVKKLNKQKSSIPMIFGQKLLFSIFDLGHKYSMSRGKWEKTYKRFSEPIAQPKGGNSLK